MILQLKYIPIVMNPARIASCDLLWPMMRIIFKASSVTPDFFYVFNLILSFSTCSESFEKICARELLGANVLKSPIVEISMRKMCWDNITRIRYGSICARLLLSVNPSNLVYAFASVIYFRRVKRQISSRYAPCNVLGSPKRKSENRLDATPSVLFSNYLNFSWKVFCKRFNDITASLGYAAYVKQVFADLLTARKLPQHPKKIDETGLDFWSRRYFSRGQNATQTKVRG